VVRSLVLVMHSRTTLPLLVLLVAALLACRAKLDGSITVDGKAVEISSCRSGDANVPSFEGVDFMIAGDRRVRFVLLEGNQIRTFLFEPGQSAGTLIGEGCGTMSAERMNSEVNGVKNLKGTVSANCTGSGHVVTAAVRFENCH
jgi:hypothetical protein